MYATTHGTTYATTNKQSPGVEFPMAGVMTTSGAATMGWRQTTHGVETTSRVATMGGAATTSGAATMDKGQTTGRVATTGGRENGLNGEQLLGGVRTDGGGATGVTVVGVARAATMVGAVFAGGGFSGGVSFALLVFSLLLTRGSVPKRSDRPPGNL
ncbi:hypothetical protein BDD12DRAFT_808332 [Trichophaea hybrida]|nr:hypothetical protein BDD12DRAFT_808332 [Trichophaea hybrida]